MRGKPVRRRQAAENDIQDILDYYVGEESPDAAQRFLDALELAVGQISRQPAAGSPRYGHELDLPGLRFRMTPRFPYLVFYLIQDDYIEITRIMHAQRDIPAWLQERFDISRQYAENPAKERLR